MLIYQNLDLGGGMGGDGGCFPGDSIDSEDNFFDICAEIEARAPKWDADKLADVISRHASMSQQT